MKLSYLFLALIGAAAFTACSGDDAPVVLGDVDAYISIGVTDGLAKTKATDEGYSSERQINNLTALVFDTNGKLVAIKDTSNAHINLAIKPSIDQIDHIKVRIADYTTGTSSTSLQIILVANATNEVKNAQTLSDLGTTLYTLPITGYKFADEPLLPMVSKIYTITGLTKDAENWVKNSSTVVPGTHAYEAAVPDGYTADDYIPLTRLNARVELVGLSASFQDGVYEGASFRLDSVFLVNVRESSRFTNIEDKVENTSAPFWRGSMEEGFTPTAQHLIHPSNNVSDVLGRKYGDVTLTDGGSSYDFDDNMFVSYMFENNNVPSTFDAQAYATRLVLMGNITSATGSDLGKRYYHVVLKDDNNKYVKANTIYRVDATLTGTGSSVPDSIPLNAGISARITVNDWILKNQDIDDINKP